MMPALLTAKGYAIHLLMLVLLVVVGGCNPKALSEAPGVEETGGVEETAPAVRAPVADGTVPLKKVDTAPKLVSSRSPQYSFEMIQNKVRGYVRANILVGADGEVKDVVVLEDIGYDSGEITSRTLREFVFEPAVKDGRSVAVWIEMTVNFFRAF